VTNDEPEHEEPEEQREPKEHEARSVDRLIFFSDAVTAIAITLLAIDLPVPQGATAAAFWASARHNDGQYLAFLVSFITIAAAWSDHHDAFRHIRRSDPRLRNLNMLWLLFIIVMPTATKLLSENGNDDLTVHAFQWGFYALLQVLISVALFAMVRHMISHHLQEPGTEDKDGKASDWRTYGPTLGFALSIPVFFVTTNAWILWIVVPVLFHRLRWLARRNRRGPRGTEKGKRQIKIRRWNGP
jgi:uncharacterized membrane protein